MEHNLYDDLDFPELLNITPAFPIITPADEELLKILPSELKALNARLEYCYCWHILPFVFRTI